MYKKTSKQNDGMVQAKLAFSTMSSKPKAYDLDIDEVENVKSASPVEGVKSGYLNGQSSSDKRKMPPWQPTAQPKVFTN